MMLFGECRSFLASSVTPNCQDITQFEAYFVAPNELGTYTIMVGYHDVSYSNDNRTICY